MYTFLRQQDNVCLIFVLSGIKLINFVNFYMAAIFLIMLIHFPFQLVETLFPAIEDIIYNKWQQ